MKTFDEEIQHRYSDLLRNIEFAIVQSAREEIGLTGQDALEALEAVAAANFAPTGQPTLAATNQRSSRKQFEVCANGGWGDKRSELSKLSPEQILLLGA